MYSCSVQLGYLMELYRTSLSFRFSSGLPPSFLFFPLYLK